MTSPAHRTAGREPLDGDARRWVSRLLQGYEALQQRQEALNHTTRRLLARLAGDDPPPPREAIPGLPFVTAVRQYERSLLMWALGRCGGQQLAAARLLGLRPTTLSEKLKRLGLRPSIASITETDDERIVASETSNRRRGHTR